ncbi:hypothetical protein [Planococcus sp. YIM B11945]|uniref:hypothetical protein n=1 Tax=Planococcus sp. YIM B11945 TaxID=3435410 RepID=UPI003D7E984E
MESEDQEAKRHIELKNKYLADLETNLAGSRKEGFKEGKESVLKTIIKNRPEMSSESIAEMLEIDIDQVKRCREELSRQNGS